MPTCVAHGCANKPDKCETGVSFHVFPRDTNLRLEWTRNVFRKNFNPSSSMVLCSRHFDEKCFKGNPERRRLLKGSIPTIFPEHPKFVQEEIERRSKIRSRSSPKPRSDCWEKKKINIREQREKEKHDAKLLLELTQNNISLDHDYVLNEDKLKKKSDGQTKALSKSFLRRKRDQNKLYRLRKKINQLKVFINYCACTVVSYKFGTF